MNGDDLDETIRYSLPMYLKLKPQKQNSQYFIYEHVGIRSIKSIQVIW